MPFAPAPSSRKNFGPGALLAALLVVVAMAIYHPSLSAPLVLDDTLNIARNASLRQLWPPALAQTATLHGRPVVNYSYALNYALAGGTATTGYHVTNLLIHVAAGLTLLGIVRRTLLLPVFEQRFENKAEIFAFGAAALWMMHPLQTDAVTYLSQRTESLMALFYLLTLYCFIRGGSSASAGRQWLMLATVACFLGMGCKEVMATAPVMVLLYDRTFLAGTFGNALKLRRGFYLGLATSWLVLFAAAFSLREQGAGFGSGVSAWKYALTESRVVPQYFALAAWPANLVFDYGGGLVKSLGEVWPQAVLLCGLVAGTTLALGFRPILGFLLAWPFLVLAPTSSFVPVANQPMAEHRMYLPLAGLAVLAVAIVDRLLPRRGWIVLLVATGSLAAATYRRNAIFADPCLLWEDTARKRPDNARAHQNLGNAYVDAGRTEEAEAAYRRALQINPLNIDGLNNLGTLVGRRGQLDEAHRLFQQAATIAPDEPATHSNLGWVFLKRQEAGAAQKEFEEALRLNPEYADAHANLANLLAQQGKYAAAIEHCTQALRINSTSAEIYATRGFAHFQLGHLSAAIADFGEAVRLDPNFEAAKSDLQTLRQMAAKAAR